jgi:hypothetical protein
MLGRLQMSVDECIKAYKAMAAKAFTPKSGFHLPARPGGVFSTSALEQAIKQVIKDECKEASCRENKGCPHADKLFRNSECCKTYVFFI